MGWEDAMQAMGLGGIGNAYKRAALREQDDLEKDLYARGYRGTPTDQIETKRGGLGSLLQSAGILGAPEPQPMTEYDKYMYDQGARAKQLQDLGYEAAKLELQGAKDKTPAAALGYILDAVKATGALPDDLLAAHPEYMDEASSMLQLVQKKNALDFAGDEATNAYKAAQAKLFGSILAGEGDPRKGPVYNPTQVQSLWNKAFDTDPTGQMLMQELYKWVGNDPYGMYGKGELGKITSGKIQDPLEAKAILDGYNAVRKRILAYAKATGIPPEYTIGKMQELSSIPEEVMQQYEQDPNMLFGQKQPGQQVEQAPTPLSRGAFADQWNNGGWNKLENSVRGQ